MIFYLNPGMAIRWCKAAWLFVAVAEMRSSEILSIKTRHGPRPNFEP